MDRDKILKSSYRSISSSLKSDQNEVSPEAALVSVCRAVDGLHGPVCRVELMRLNSYFSWNSPTFPCSRSFEKLSVSTSFSSSATRPTIRVRLITSSPTVFIIRSSRDSAMRTDFAAAAAVPGSLTGFLAGAATGAASSDASAGAPSLPVGRVTASESSTSIGANSAIRPSSESTPVRIAFSSAHWRCKVFFRTSTDSRQMSTTAGEGSSSPSRKRPIRSSTRWAIAPSLLSPTWAADPFTVWIARKSLLISSGLLLPSSEIRQSLTTCKCSSASGWKNSNISSGTSSSEGSASK